MTQPRVIEVLTAGPFSSCDIAQTIGSTQNAVLANLRRLKAKKMVYIARYDRMPPGQPGGMIPVYALGSRNNTPKPKAKTRYEICRDSNARHAAIISAKRYPHIRQSLGVWAGLI